MQVVVLVLAALGKFSLWGAVLVDVGTALIVILNGMTLLRWTRVSGSKVEGRGAGHPPASTHHEQIDMQDHEKAVNSSAMQSANGGSLTISNSHEGTSQQMNPAQQTCRPHKCCRGH